MLIAIFQLRNFYFTLRAYYLIFALSPHLATTTIGISRKRLHNLNDYGVFGPHYAFKQL